MELFLKQYDYVQRTREILFNYCEKMTDDEYITEVGQFGHGSIRETHFHVAECYAFWLGEFGLGRTFDWRLETAMDVAAMRSLFAEADKLVHEFLEHYPRDFETRIEGQFSGQKFVATPLWLFTHTVTHEFHHKGQIATMGRMKGYIPPDLDLIMTDGLEET
ncbi:DNA damage-inducible protein DinB [Paenibacillus sp. J23TS9]|uniref:DinB family protein n=1 Tax=Paenibacillus sp. J23TS9 TaxID=2807193 RepID=UPI001B265A29|nr:DinB family protein [Paenibacillus sp. J23TS9]GIP26166.1 DNA damage-inducible protein DinB [Paenibacillus sp. J23TS9]